MKIKFINSQNTKEYINEMVIWYNDPEIAPFIHVNFTEAKPKDYTHDDVQRELQPNAKISKYTIVVNDQAIGELSITKDFFLLMKKDENSAWISIMIGKRSYWGKGISKQAMEFLENKCREMGFNRIELGVFDNNIKAYNLYTSLAYTEFARIEHFTYSQAKWRADIRMEKYI